MDRITVKDVRQAFKVYSEVFTSYGLIRDGHRLGLQQGEPSAGLGWRIYERAVDGTGGLSSPLVGDGYLGWSAREAYDRLHDRLSVVHGMAYMCKRGPE